MKNILRSLLVGAIVGLAGLVLTRGAEAQDYDDYWGDYWRWYDNDYAPYYSRRYARDPYYGYRDSYYYRGYRGWEPSGGVEVGPLGIYWR